MMKSTGSFDVKRLFKKKTIKRTLLELLLFWEVFNFFYKFIKYIDITNDVKMFIK